MVTPTISSKFFSPNYWTVDIGQFPIKGVVVHGTASRGLMDAVNHLCNPDTPDPGSSSYIIDTDGAIYVLVDPYQNRRAWANGVFQAPDTSRDLIRWCSQNGVNPNRVTISIEHVASSAAMYGGPVYFGKNPSAPSRMTKEQEEASLWLVTKLCRDFKLGEPSTQNVLPHSAFMSRDRAYCPGVINLPRYVEVAQQLYRTGSTVPQYGEIKDATGFTIRGEILQFAGRLDSSPVKRIQALGLALSEEFTGPNGRTAQVYERQVVEFFDKLVGTGWQVQGMHLGRIFMEKHAQQIGKPIPVTDTLVADEFQVYRKQLSSGKSVRGEDLALVALGFPISDAFIDPLDGRLTQYFERSCLKLYKENRSPWNVQGVHLGRMYKEQFLDKK